MTVGSLGRHKIVRRNAYYMFVTTDSRMTSGTAGSCREIVSCFRKHNLIFKYSKKEQRIKSMLEICRIATDRFSFKKEEHYAGNMERH